MRRGRMRTVFLRDMMLAAQIGVYAHEHGRTQRIRVNLWLEVDDPEAAAGRLAPGPDHLERVLDYEAVVVMVRDIVARGHVRLVETLAERVAAGCLADPRVSKVRVRIEKLDVFPELESVGIEIIRHAAD
ncbi:dihydroneopterin aldolase [Endobacter medicaginis]|nr:dihydroneopterin aldolase [Endobacter medicaginis]MBB3172766.1 dihydroneopterin aldolase [Endobacter medicaginis]MCX5474373.1 dihydroneopterin aldolase [Endobacter medicaginis]